MPSKPFSVQLISPTKFGRLGPSAVRYSPRLSEEEFYKLWSDVREELRDALAQHWVDGEPNPDWRPFWRPREDKQQDFMVSDECQEAWSHCGGVYTPRICCPEYVRTICGVLAKTRHADKWSYHTTVELWVFDRNLPFVCGQILIKRATLYIPKDGVDYSAFYGKN